MQLKLIEVFFFLWHSWCLILSFSLCLSYLFSYLLFYTYWFFLTIDFPFSRTLLNFKLICYFYILSCMNDIVPSTNNFQSNDVNFVLIFLFSKARLKIQKSPISRKFHSEFSHFWVFDFALEPKSKTPINKTRKKNSEICEFSEFSTWPIEIDINYLQYKRWRRTWKCFLML